MNIPKQAEDAGRYLRGYFSFPSARSAFAAFLRACRLGPTDVVLLPAYIGWSPREGSGVFDPIAEGGFKYDFYRLDSRLHIDLEHLESMLRSNPVRLVLLIHYFGYVDPAYPEAVAMARSSGALVLEDEAHAMLTDLIGNACGRLGDACLFSLHKMLPVRTGGMLVTNPEVRFEVTAGELPQQDTVVPWHYDLAAIASKRRENAQALDGLLRRLGDWVDPLRQQLGPGEVPQTYPLLVRPGCRDQIYFAMNSAGFGVVSLYHTMISFINPQRFSDAHQISQRILNLPVHQDVVPDQLEAMVRALKACVRSLG